MFHHRPAAAPARDPTRRPGARHLAGPALLAAAIATMGVAVPPIRADPGQGARIGGGTSPSGQRWTPRAAIEHGRLDLQLFLPIGDGDGGAGTSFPWRSREPLVVDHGSGLGTADEWEIDGTTTRAVARLRVTIGDGTTVTFRPHRAPRAALRRFPHLASHRYFVRFFPAARQPLVVEALSTGGRVLARQQVGEP